MDKHIEELLSMMVDIIRADGNWTEKRDAIVNKTKEQEEWATALGEFLAWFEPEGESP